MVEVRNVQICLHQLVCFFFTRTEHEAPSSPSAASKQPVKLRWLRTWAWIREEMHMAKNDAGEEEILWIHTARCLARCTTGTIVISLAFLP